MLLHRNLMLFKFNDIPDLCIDICIIYSSISITKQECIPVGMHSTRSSSHQLERSASVHVGIHPLGVGLETPQVWTWRPSGCGPGDPTGVSLENRQVWACRSPPQCGPGNTPSVGLENPLGRPLKLPLGFGPGNLQRHPGIPTHPPPRPARHAGIPPARYAGIPTHPPETCKACWDTTCKVCWDTTPL